MSSAKKIGLFACTGVVAGNMMGSGIALLPANLASIGGIAIWGWVISIIGAMSLAYVYARLATKNPQQGGPIAYAGEISPAFGFQTGVLYYHANWIGNLAIGITAVSYLSTFFPILNNPVPAGIACIAIVWIFTFVNMLGGTWVSRLTTIGLVLVLIPVVMTAVVGWHWFDVATYQANWNTSSTTDSHAVIKSILLCLWAFVGVESAAVSTGMVKNPKRTVPLATMLGTAMAGIVYIAATQVIAGMYPASQMAASGAPFAISASTILGGWAAPMVSAFTGIPVRADVAMTGEITLRGEVLPIGGLKEKLLAALRGGIQHVMIPHDNVKDLEEIPQNVKDGLQIHPVKWIDEVLSLGLERQPEPWADKAVPTTEGTAETATLSNPRGKSSAKATKH